MTTDLAILNSAIAQLAKALPTAPVRSKEGAAAAVASLLKTRAELYPTTADGLAELAVRLNIGPAEFIEALKAKWENSCDRTPETTTK